jgi:C4-dicarboxylate transporter DctM subunit
MTTIIVFAVMFALLFFGIPIAWAIGGAAVIIIIATSNIDLSLFVTSALTSLDSFTLMAIPFFILAGKLMEKGGISERLIDLANLIVGKMIGGLAMVTILACTAFGAISGSSIATSVAIGGIMLPGMGKSGYKKEFSAALICIAGTIGALIPPSMTFIIFGALTGVSISDLFIAGILPGILLALALAVTAYIISKKRGYRGVEYVDRTPKNVGRVLKRSVSAILVPVIILGGIYSGLFTPTEAGTVACLYAIILIVFVYRTLNLKGMIKVFSEAMRYCVITMIVVAFASGLARFFTIEMLPQQISSFIISLSDSPIIFLLFVNLLLLLVGCIMDTTAAMIVLAPIFLPIAMNYGIQPVHFGIIMSFNLLLGLCTPPVGSNLFVVSSMTKLPIFTLGKAMLPFYAAAFISLFLVTYVPFISLALLGIGN